MDRSLVQVKQTRSCGEAVAVIVRRKMNSAVVAMAPDWFVPPPAAENLSACGTGARRERMRLPAVRHGSVGPIAALMKTVCPCPIGAMAATTNRRSFST